MTGSDWNNEMPSEPAPAVGQPGSSSGEPAAFGGEPAARGGEQYGAEPAEGGQSALSGEHPGPAGSPSMGPAYPADPTFATGPVGSDTVEFGPTAPSEPPRRRRLVIAASAAVVAAAAVAAVAIAETGGSSAQTPEQVLAAAAHKSAAVKTLSATFDERVSGASSGNIAASVQEVRKPLQLSLALSENIDGQTIPLSMILTTKSIYIKFGQIPGLPASVIGKWIEFPLADVGNGVLYSLLQSAEKENPASQTQLLLASKHLRADGTQVIDGVQTTRYVGYFTAADALKMLTPAQRAALAPAMQQITGRINFSVWIDGSDQIRKIAETESVGSDQVNFGYTFLSFNQPVNIAIPPPSKVLHIPASALNGDS
jgi:hypothetical protein